ncbi:MAG: helix-turn-helix transcriptional regulator [Candidatus Paceibacterota bacterium]|jgi:transcriptional regulator with XRE-family HTH domain
MNYKECIKKYNIDTNKKDLSFELSNLITEARIYAGISQAELAKRMKTSQPNIARAESGNITPSLTFLIKVAEAVGTSLILPKFDLMANKKFTSPFRDKLAVSLKNN